MKEILTRNNWLDPIDTTSFLNTPKELALFILKNKYSDVIPIFLKNHGAFLNLPLSEINDIITISCEVESSPKLGVINLVDLFYRFVNINLLHEIWTSATMSKEHKYYILNYFYTLHGSLFIDYSERTRILETFGTNNTQMNLYKNQYLVQGGELAYTTKKIEEAEKGIVVITFDKESHERFFEKYLNTSTSVVRLRNT